MVQKILINLGVLLQDFASFKENLTGDIQSFEEKNIQVFCHQLSQYMNDVRVKAFIRNRVQDEILSAFKNTNFNQFYQKVNISDKAGEISDTDILNQNLEYLNKLADLLIEMAPKNCKSLNAVLYHLKEFSDKKIPQFVKDSQVGKDAYQCKDRIEEAVYFYSSMLTICKNYIENKDCKSFQKNSKQAIDEAHITFDQHRGMKNFLYSLLLAVLTGGFSYFVTAAYQKTFFPVIINTDSANRLSIIESNVKIA